jgi:hypothetical protein
MTSVIAIVWRYLGFNTQPLWLRQEELRASLRCHDRRAQHMPEVESKAGKAMRMMALVSVPGKYVGLGHKVIKERRRRPRIRQY